MSKENCIDAMQWTTSELSQTLNISVRTIQRLTQEGVFRCVGHRRKENLYVITEAVPSYLAYLEQKYEHSETAEKIEQLKTQKLKAEVALKESQSELHRLKTDLAKGIYLSVEDVQRDYEKFFTIFKKFALSIPARLGGVLSGKVDTVTQRGIENDLHREITQMLRQFVVAGQSPKT